jgi:hypothetical protein
MGLQKYETIFQDFDLFDKNIYIFCGNTTYKKISIPLDIL